MQWCILHIWDYMVMREYHKANEGNNRPTENITESTRMKIRTKVVLTLLNDLSHEAFKKLVFGEESMRKKLLNIIILKLLNNSSDVELSAFIEDINHTRERSDGSSDGLHEALDIVLENGYRECSNWNTDLQQIWTLNQLFPDDLELKAEDEMELFTRIQKSMFSDESRVSWRDQLEVYNRMKRLLDEIDGLIRKLI